MDMDNGACAGFILLAVLCRPPLYARNEKYTCVIVIERRHDDSKQAGSFGNRSKVQSLKSSALGLWAQRR